jgi:hypothetical protein
MTNDRADAERMVAKVRIAETTAALAKAARDAGMIVTGDGRIRESDAAQLLGLNPESLGRMRREGRAPYAYAIAISGSKVSYRLADLSAWLENKRDAA